MPARQCVQSTDPRCTREALSALVGKFNAVKAAYCNDQYLVITTSMAPNFTPMLDDPKTPPGATDAVSGACVTRMSSITASLQTYKIPLQPTLLPTASNTNNLGAFDFAGDAEGGGVGYLRKVTRSVGLCIRVWIVRRTVLSVDKGMDNANTGMDNAQADGTVYGLNARGPVGVAVSGQEIFPLYNNRGTNTLQDCEVDACNEHVGGGGGQPHLHGDPFHATDGVCLYGPGNYTSDWAHPPQIGWSLDGCAIFGPPIQCS